MKDYCKESWSCLSRLDNKDKSNWKGYLRLNRSERATHFPNDFFSSFISELEQEDILTYPPTALLYEELATFSGLREAQFLLVPGSDAGIRTIFNAFGGERKKVVISSPSFPMYSVYGKLYGSSLVEIGYTAEKKLDCSAITEEIDNGADLVAIANPVSPIGDLISASDLEKILSVAASRGVVVFIDEAYWEYAGYSSINLIEEFDNLVISRTFSKAFGAAGLRCGYLVSSEGMMDCIRKDRQLYEVNSFAIKFAIKLLRNPNVTFDYVNAVNKTKKRIVDNLLGVSHRVIDSHANWIHLNFGNITSQIEGFLSDHNVLYKSDTRVPWSPDARYIRLTVAPDMDLEDPIRTVLNSLNAIK